MGHQRNVKKDRKWLRATLARFDKKPPGVVAETSQEKHDSKKALRVLMQMGRRRARRLLLTFPSFRQPSSKPIEELPENLQRR